MGSRGRLPVDDEPGLCWLSHCKSADTRVLRAGGYVLVLCASHRAELEASAHNGYSVALPPTRGGTWNEIDGYFWWPWELEKEYDDGSWEAVRW